eukprot:XP_024448021.1 TMV resistance protein N-like [Populus trichocarpa]
MSGYSCSEKLGIEIRNNTSGQSLRRQAHVLDMRFEDEVREIQSLSHWKLGGDDPTFDNGDDVIISMVVTSAIQIRTVGVEWLHEEEGKDDDIQSKDEVINAHNSSDDDDAAHTRMAAGKYQESYSSRFSNCKYQVFLSFRGEDTRKNFTDHLYMALVQAGIHTFRDDDEIRRGENIDFELQKAIQQSKISIIVFSKDYASSRWCLDELVMIMERKRNDDCIVLPVFYDVDPSQVGRQTGSFAAAFVKHEKSFNEEKERVSGWRIALKEVTDLAGMVLGDG